jgi:hypothetical protein
MSQSDLCWFQTGFPLVRFENWHVSHCRVRVNQHVRWYNRQNECWPDIRFQSSPRDTNKGLFALEAEGHCIPNLIVPHFFGWDLGKTHGPCLKGLSSQRKPNLDHMQFLIRNILIKKSLEMWLS